MTAGSAIGLHRWKNETPEAVLLDLGGTLLDCVDDIVVALNRALAEQLLGSLAPDQVRELIGRGFPTLIARALTRLGAPADALHKSTLLERFLFHYRWLRLSDQCNASVYPGVADGLGKLHALGLRLAVVTNRRKSYAVDLLNRSGLSHWIQVVVGGDSCKRRKPDPQPVLLACEALHVDPGQALMVGDSVTDVLAAHAAGLLVVCLHYGYHEDMDRCPLSCDAVIETLADLPALLLGPPGPLMPHDNSS